MRRRFRVPCSARPEVDDKYISLFSIADRYDLVARIVDEDWLSEREKVAMAKAMMESMEKMLGKR